MRSKANTRELPPINKIRSELFAGWTVGDTWLTASSVAQRPCEFREEKGLYSRLRCLLQAALVFQLNVPRGHVCTEEKVRCEDSLSKPLIELVLQQLNSGEFV